MSHDFEWRATPGDERCDFCRAPKPPWEIRCAKFRLRDVWPDGSGYQDDGRWAACDLCLAILERRDVAQLVAHAMIANEKLFPLAPRDKYAANLRRMYQAILDTMEPPIRFVP